MSLQKTIGQPVKLEGTGLHSGLPVTVRLKPSKENSGIRFIRTDLPGAPDIKADTEHLLAPARSPRRTSIGRGGSRVDMIEHLMAVLHAAGIDNIIVEISGVEMPGLDGSAAGYTEAVHGAGVVAQNAARKTWSIRKSIVCSQGDAVIMAHPDDKLSISCRVVYDGGIPPEQQSSFVLETENGFEAFSKEIAPARTFCSEKEGRAARALGLGKGASLKNTLVFNESGVIDNELRFDNECARHKVLDVMGDLFLLNGEIKARIEGVKNGHALNYKLVHEIIKQGDSNAKG